MRFSLTFFNPNNWVIGWYKCYSQGSKFGLQVGIFATIQDQILENAKISIQNQRKKNIIANSKPSYHRRNMKWQNQVLSVLLCILN